MNRTRLTRPRVTQRIARAAEYPVTAIVAPAGFGKSVALTDYLATERVDHVRYDVRSDHNTLFEFVRGLAKALEVRVPLALASFAGAQERAMAADDAPTDLARWMLEHLQAPLTIVIDDLHNAGVDPQANRFLTQLIERSYHEVRWVLASRSAIELPIASWLAYEKLDSPIDENDLRFTVEEALAAASDSAIGENGADELLRLTGGWPVAFSIGLRSAARMSELEKLADGTRDMIYRYLAEQVYGRLSEEEREFLLQTCVYPWLDYSIIEKRGDAPALLVALRKDAGFVYAASETEYRYHDLFREFLESELRRRGDAAFRQTVCSAAVTLEELDRIPEALTLYAKVGETNEILRLVSRFGFELIDRGRTDIVEACLAIVPEEARADAAIVQGMEAVLASRRGHLPIAQQRYLYALDKAQEPRMKAEISYRYAIDLVRARQEGAVELLEPYAGNETLEVTLRAAILATLATAHIQGGNAPSATRFIEQALTLLERSPNAVLRAKIYQQAAHVMFFSGDVVRSRQYANSAIELATAHGVYEVASRAYSMLYNISLDIDDDPISSLRHLENVEECARKAGSSQMLLFALLAVYGIESERGDTAALARLDAQINELQMALPHWVSMSLLPARALRAAWDNNFSEAFALLEGTAAEQGTAERQALRWAEIAVYALAANLFQPAEAAIESAYAELRRCDAVATARILRTSLFLAVAELLRGKELAAHRLIVDVERGLQASMRRLHAFARAVRAIYNRVVDPENQLAVTAALERLRAEQLGGLAQLLAALSFGTDENRGLASLTASERAILRALALGASSKQIAAETGRSPQTVDVHIRSICRKLDCRGRIEAIAVARNSGWFADEK